MSIGFKLGYPNIVICLCDQLRPFELSCYGHPIVTTPNIDWLANQGVMFEQAVTNNPVCTPARSSLLSGQYSRTCVGNLGNTTDEAPSYYSRNGFTDSILPEILKELGYYSCLIGKWHIDAHPKLMGFDYYVYPKVHHLNKNQLYFDTKGRAFITNGYTADYNKNVLESCLGQFKGNKSPFFIFYNISAPHMPFFDIPDCYRSHYSPNQVKLRDNVWVDGEMAYNERWFKIYMWDYIYYMKYFNKELHLPSNFDLRNLTALYYGMVKYADDQVGELIKSLEKYHLLDNTMIVFASDHGDNLGSHHLFNKDCLYEESIRIPLIFCCPKLFRAYVNRRQIAQIIDIVPTILDICGVDIPQFIQGQSLMPVLSGNKQELSNNQAFIETSRYDIGIRTPSYLFGMSTSSENSGEIEKDLFLFDLELDPFEMDNKLSDQSKHEIFKKLKRTLINWHENTPWYSVQKGIRSH